MSDKISYFDAIAINKRNTIILLACMFFLYLFMDAVLSYYLGLDICGLIIGLLILIGYAFVTFYSGDQIILWLNGAKELKHEDAPYIFNVVEGLAIASSIPVPKIYVMEDPAPNAFAVGRDPSKSAVAITRGLLNILNKQEIEGVLAHEVSHIANYDTRFNMVAVVFAGAMALIADFGWRMFLGGGSRDRNIGILGLLALVFAILSPIFAEIVRFAISRQRESLADANGAKLIRDPLALASALEKIKNANMPTKSANNTTASLYFANPFPNSFAALFSTHPPIDERIKRLKGM